MIFNKIPSRKKKTNVSKESEYVNYFYGKYHGRVALGVGYNQYFSQIHPFIFHDKDGRPIGIVAMGIITGKKRMVHIYHIGAFITRRGNGSRILKELCRKADHYNIRLSASPVYMPNGVDPQMAYNRLSKWYNQFNFKGESNLMRPPKLQAAGF